MKNPLLRGGTTGNTFPLCKATRDVRFRRFPSTNRVIAGSINLFFKLLHKMLISWQAKATSAAARATTGGLPDLFSEMKMN